MVSDSFISALREIGISFSENEPMKNHTSFRIGGAADVFISVRTVSGLSSVLRLLKQFSIPFFILGRGSNLLVSDDGIEGAVISLADICDISCDGCELTCGAGASMSAVCRAALDNSLSGLEFAYGIPGSAGGALFMNAGAYGGEMSQAVTGAVCLTPEGEIIRVAPEEMKLGYRDSAFRRNGLIITEISLCLTRGDRRDIESRMNDLISRRREKQPLEYPSAGSTFKRPEGYFAGALIQKNGLMGKSVGGAAVSDKHAGFIINRGGATCRDVEQLIETIRNTVRTADGVELEPEVLRVGRITEEEK